MKTSDNLRKQLITAIDSYLGVHEKGIRKQFIGTYPEKPIKPRSFTIRFRPGLIPRIMDIHDKNVYGGMYRAVRWVKLNDLIDLSNLDKLNPQQLQELKQKSMENSAHIFDQWKELYNRDAHKVFALPMTNERAIFLRRRYELLKKIGDQIDFKLSEIDNRISEVKPKPPIQPKVDRQLATNLPRLDALVQHVSKEFPQIQLKNVSVMKQLTRQERKKREAELSEQYGQRVSLDEVQAESDDEAIYFSQPFWKQSMNNPHEIETVFLHEFGHLVKDRFDSRASEKQKQQWTGLFKEYQKRKDNVSWVPESAFEDENELFAEMFVHYHRARNLKSAYLKYWHFDAYTLIDSVLGKG